jgi:hypothetical protein
VVNTDNPPSDSVADAAAQTIPNRLRTPLVVLVLLHFCVLIFCLTSSYRLSGLAIEWLGYLSPYAVTTNMRMDLQPLAITNPSALETPLIVEFGSKDTNAWKRWPDDSRLGNKPGVTRLREQRYLGQISGLMEVRSEDGILNVIAAMHSDIQSQHPSQSLDRVRISMRPVVRAEEWEYAQRFSKTDQLPEALQPEVMVSANIVRMKDSSIRVLPQIEDFRTAPTIK